MFFSKILLPILFLTLYNVSFGQVSLGYANSEYVLTSHPLYEKAVEDYNTEQIKVSDEFMKKEENLNRKMTEYHEMINNGVTEEAIAEKQAELEKLDQELTRVANEFELYLNMKQDELMKPIINDVNEALVSVSKNLGLSAVLQTVNSDGVSFVLYAPDETEVTGHLLREIGSNKADNYTTKYKSDPNNVKIGYTNIELVLMYMPEYADMQNAVVAYTDKLSAEYVVKSDSVYMLYNEYQEKVAKGLLSMNGEQYYLKKIEEKRKELEFLASEGNEKIELLRSEKMEAVLTVLEDAIGKVAIANGFNMILNQTTSSGVSTILFGPSEGDITSALLEEIGADTDLKEKAMPVSKKSLKVGFVNIDVILSKMPEFMKAKENIDAFENSLLSEQKIASELLSPKDQEKSWVMAEEDFQRYRLEQLTPMLEQIQAEIDTIAKMENYDYIINRTGDNVLQVADENNLQSALMKALGIN